MKQKGFLISVFIILLGLFLCAGNATAHPIVDGNFGLDEWAGYYNSEDTDKTVNHVDPGYGGQAYDVEYLGLYVTSDKLYFGLQTGFDLETGRNWGSLHFNPGDFALDVDQDGNYDYAIDFSINGSTATYTLYGNPVWKNAEYSNSWGGVSDPFENINTNPNDILAKFTGVYNSSAKDVFGNSSHVLEGCLDLSYLVYSGGPITIHWTMECGNDYLNQTSAPVPEPATMLLFGVGLIGMAAGSRKKFLKKDS